jgi:myosin heavy subunit
MENLKIITKHFSRDTKANVIYEENACPSTDGRNITLPTRVNSEYADETIGAMLHETSHIRYTQFDNMPNLSSAEFDCLNVLEDIRIDYKTCKEYPNAKYFYETLLDECIQTKGDALRNEPQAVKVLKSLLIHADGRNPSDVYTDDEKTLELFEKYKGLVGIARQAESTESLVDYARQLCKQLFDDTKDSKQDDKLDEEIEQLNQQREELHQQCSELDDKADKQQAESTRCKRNMTANFNKASKQVDKEKADEYMERAKEWNEKLDESNEKLEKDNEEYQNTREEYLQTKKQQREKENEKESRESNGFKSDPDADIKGFTALDKSKVKDDNSNAISSTETLDSIIADKVISRRDSIIHDDEGVVLNANKLHDLYTDVDELFNEDEVKEYKTKVSFIIDSSGSMGNANCPSDRASLCVRVTKLFADAIKKAQLRGAPIELDLFAFGDTVGKLCNLDDYDEQTLNAQYNNAQYDLGGGTELVECVNHITDDMKQNLDTDSDAVAIVLTDAEIGEYQLKALVNQADSDDVRFVFIAITPDRWSQTNESFQQVFGDNVVNSHDDNDVIDVITRVMLDWEQ